MKDCVWTQFPNIEKGVENTMNNEVSLFNFEFKTRSWVLGFFINQNFLNGENRDWNKTAEI